MSLNHITSSATYNPWLNLNGNDFKCQTLETAGGVTFTGPFTITETTKSSINGAFPSGSELLQIKNTDTSASSYQMGLFVTNSTNNSVKLGVQNTTNTGQIWSDNSLTIQSFSNPGTIILSPNSGNALQVSSVDGIAGNTSTLVNGNISVSNQPYLELKIPSNASIPSGSDTTVTTLSTVVRNVGGIVYTTGTFTVPSTGVYTISYSGQWATGATGTRGFQVLVGSTVYASSSDSIANASDPPAQSSSTTVYLTPSNTFNIQAFQTSGSAQNVTYLDVIVYKCS